MLEGVPKEGTFDITKLSEATSGYSGAEVDMFFSSCLYILIVVEQLLILYY